LSRCHFRHLTHNKKINQSIVEEEPNGKDNTKGTKSGDSKEKDNLVLDDQEPEEDEDEDEDDEDDDEDDEDDEQFMQELASVNASAGFDDIAPYAMPKTVITPTPTPPPVATIVTPIKRKQFTIVRSLTPLQPSNSPHQQLKHLHQRRGETPPTVITRVPTPTINHFTIIRTQPHPHVHAHNTPPPLFFKQKIQGSPVIATVTSTTTSSSSSSSNPASNEAPNKFSNFPTQHQPTTTTTTTTISCNTNHNATPIIRKLLTLQEGGELGGSHKGTGRAAILYDALVLDTLHGQDEEDEDDEGDGERRDEPKVAGKEQVPTSQPATMLLITDVNAYNQQHVAGTAATPVSGAATLRPVSFISINACNKITLPANARILTAATATSTSAGATVTSQASGATLTVLTKATAATNHSSSNANELTITAATSAAPVATGGSSIVMINSTTTPSSSTNSTSCSAAAHQACVPSSPAGMGLGHAASIATPPASAPAQIMGGGPAQGPKMFFAMSNPVRRNKLTLKYI